MAFKGRGDAQMTFSQASSWRHHGIILASCYGEIDLVQRMVGQWGDDVLSSIPFRAVIRVGHGVNGENGVNGWVGLANQSAMISVTRRMCISLGMRKWIGLEL